jgi:hypothetical protein
MTTPSFEAETLPGVNTCYPSGQMSAKTLCDIAWHADRAGASNVSDLAVNPSSVHQAEHLRNVLNTTSPSDFYFADVPMWNHTTQHRELRKYPMSLPHERFAVECQNFDVCSYQRSDFPPRYWHHPVTLAKGHAKTVPIGYFSDGVPHTKKDSFLAFYWSNLLTGFWIEAFQGLSIRSSVPYGSSAKHKHEILGAEVWHNVL